MLVGAFLGAWATAVTVAVLLIALNTTYEAVEVGPMTRQTVILAIAVPAILGAIIGGVVAETRYQRSRGGW